MIDYLFYIFATITLISANAMIFFKNPVKALLCLILSFVTSAMIWMLLAAEFLSIALILVYVGAVLVLFMFVIMMLDVDTAELKASFIKYLPVGICVSVLFLIAIVFTFNTYVEGINADFVEFSKANNVKAMGELLYTDYILAIEIAGLILLAAMVAAITLTFRGAIKRKSQSIHSQVQVTKQDRLKVIKMTSESGS